MNFFQSFIYPSLFLLPLVFTTNVYGQFSFVVAADQRWYAGTGNHDSSDYFRGVAEAVLRTGSGAFLLSPGDIDPPSSSHWTIRQVFGDEYQWFPVVGNHELPEKGQESVSGENMDWLRNFNTDINGTGSPPDIVNYGPWGCPQTTYSFDYLDSHFVLLNEYCDAEGDTATSGDISDHLYSWLQDDLLSTEKDRVFVFGHEPAYPQPDLDNGRFRHYSDSLNVYANRRDRFWNLLKQEGVTAYINGHTHNYSMVRMDSVWQIDSGHARGQGDTGAPSTYVRIDVGNTISFTAYRDTHDGTYDYTDIIHSGVLAGPAITASMTFCNGSLPAAGYDGMRDTTISQHAPQRNFGDSPVLSADGDDPPGSGEDLAALLFWDISAIPSGSTVHSVSVTLQVSDPATDGYRLQGIQLPWSEHRASWLQADEGAPWQQKGALGPADRSADVLAYFAPARTGSFTFFLNQQGKELVQSWIDDPSANKGFIVGNMETGDRFDFAASESQDFNVRPKLMISYSAPVTGPSTLPWLLLLLGE